MKTRMPTTQEINELIAFLPRLYAQGFVPIMGWGGGTKGEDGVITLPWPKYDEIVEEFFQVASRKCWSDYDYSPEVAGQMLERDEVMQTANLSQIKTMLTYCVRGERFSVGHWAAMIEGGNIRRLLGRLAELVR